MLKLAPSALINSTADRESKPADIQWRIHALLLGRSYALNPLSYFYCDRLNRFVKHPTKQNVLWAVASLPRPARLPLGAMMPLQPNELAPPVCVLPLYIRLVSTDGCSTSARTWRTCGLSVRSCTLSAVSPSFSNPITSMTFATPAVDSV